MKYTVAAGHSISVNGVVVKEGQEVKADLLAQNTLNAFIKNGTVLADEQKSAASASDATTSRKTK